MVSSRSSRQSTTGLGATAKESAGRLNSKAMARAARAWAKLEWTEGRNAAFWCRNLEKWEGKGTSSELFAGGNWCRIIIMRSKTESQERWRGVLFSRSSKINVNVAWEREGTMAAAAALTFMVVLYIDMMMRYRM